MISKEDVMNYPDAFDIDWFIVFKNGKIAHFASGSGQIPRIVLDNYDDLNILLNYFNNLPNSTNVVNSPFMKEYLSAMSNSQRRNYLKSYYSWASKGLFSFDKTIFEKPNDTTYHLVAFPEKEIFLDSLPINIQELLIKLRINIDYDSQKKGIDISSIL